MCLTDRPQKNFWNAAPRLGFPTVTDPNAGQAIGIFRLLHSVDPATQTRSYSKSAHYDRVKVRSNYHILPNTAVSKVLFQGKVATGVEFIDRATGVKSSSNAAKEVIIAAGAVHSPQILQLSGIGPAALLGSLNIKTVADLPGVGSNLQDHLVATVNYRGKFHSSSEDDPSQLTSVVTNNLFPNGGSLDAKTTYDTEQRALYDLGEPSAYTITRTTGNLIIFLSLKQAVSKWASLRHSVKAHNPLSVLPPDTHPKVLDGYVAQRAQICQIGPVANEGGPDLLPRLAGS
jgi:hypothetical protein